MGSDRCTTFTKPHVNNRSTSMASHNHILVVGCGVIGLQTAVCLLEQDSRSSVTIWAEKTKHETTSFGAGASYTPETNLGPLEKTKLWCKRTLNHLKLLSEDSQATGVYFCDGYRFQSEETKTIPADFITFGFENVTHVTQSNDTEKVLENTLYTHAWKYNTACVDMPRYLCYLEDRFYQLGGKHIIKRKVTLNNLVSAPFNIIVNCTGLGARELFNDKEMIPIRGQTIKMHIPGAKEQFYKAKEKNGDVTYVYPRGNGIFVLGGTFQPEEHDTTVNQETAKSILERCARMVPQLNFNAQVLDHWVGLRPHRKTGVRLEFETIQGKLFLHHYGHSGSGVTLSYGSSLEAAQMINKKSKL